MNRTCAEFLKGSTCAIFSNAACRSIQTRALTVAMVHGGLTFSNFIPAERGGVDGLWFLGFDCAHLGDLMPGLESLIPIRFETNATYKDLPFVKEECASLAAQLKEMEAK